MSRFITIFSARCNIYISRLLAVGPGFELACLGDVKLLNLFGQFFCVGACHSIIITLVTISMVFVVSEPFTAGESSNRGV